MAELKPCPFCGGQARRYEGNHDGFGVCCTKCSAKVYGCFSKAGATKAWNRRAEPQKLFDAVSNIDWGAECE